MQVRSLREMATARAISRFSDSFFAGINFIEQLARLTEDELTRLKVRQADLITSTLDPGVSDSEIFGLARGMAVAHSMIGVESVRILRCIPIVIGYLTDALSDLGVEPSESMEIVAWSTTRMTILLDATLEVEAEFERSLHGLVTSISEICHGSTTSADLATRVLSRLADLSGVSIAYIARPGTNEVLQIEYLTGSAVGRYEQFRDAESTGGFGEGFRELLSRCEARNTAWETGSVESVASLVSDASLSDLSKLHRDLGVRSYVGIPISDSSGGPRALLGIYSKWSGYFEPASRRRFIEYLRQMLGVAMEKLDDGGVTEYRVRQRYSALLSGGRVRMLFQPIVRLSSGELDKVEALARLVDFDGSVISPGEFLPALGVDDLFVLFEEAVKQSIAALELWRSAGLHIKVSVNLPIQGMTDVRYLSFLEALISDGLLSASDVTLELTEEKDHLDGGGSADFLKDLQSLGFKLAQDDLGSGYSSLSRLEKIRFDEVKIDQTLVRTSSDPRSSLPLIEHLTHLAHDLGVSVVVEGLESEALVEAARIIGADFGQGFAIAKPMEAKLLVPWSVGSSWRPLGARPRTALGALAELRRWTQRVDAISNYPEILVDSRLLGELRDALLYLTDPNMRKLLDQLGRAMRIGIGFEYRAALAQINDTLLKQLDVGSVPDWLGVMPSFEHFDRGDESLTRDELTTLLDVHSALVRCEGLQGDSEVVPDAICEIAEMYLLNSVAMIMTKRTDGTPIVVAGPSLTPGLWKEFDRAGAESLGPYFDATIRSGHPVFVGNTVTDPRWSDLQDLVRDCGFRSSWSVPVFDDSGGIVGSFSVASHESRMPTRFQKLLMEACASFAAIALSRSKLIKEHQFKLMRQPEDTTALLGIRFSVRVDGGRFFNVSDEAKSFYGFEGDEWHRLTIFDINVGIDQGMLAGLADRIEDGRLVHMTATHRLSNGDLREVEFYTKLRVTLGVRYLDSSFLDFTDRSVSERMLVSDRTLRHRIINTGAFIAIVVDPMGFTLFANELVLSIIDVAEDQMLGKPFPWREFVGEAGEMAVQGCVHQAIYTGSSRSTELWFTSAGGVRRRFTVRSSPVIDSQSAITSIVFTGVDTTDRHEADLQLSNQRNLLSQILESLTSIVIVMDTNGRVVECNRALEEFSGMSLAEMNSKIGVSLSFFAPEARETGLKWFERAVQGELDTQAIAPWIDKSGETHLFEWHSSTISDRDGTLQYVVSVGVDITDQQRRNDEIALAAVVFQGAREGIVITNASGTIVDVNSGYCRISGYIRSECIGQNAGFWRSGQHDRKFYSEMFDELSSNGFWTGTIWNRGRSGALLPILMQITAIFGEGGTVNQYVGICTEITEMLEYQNRLTDLAFHDLLTGLPNRSLLAERIKQAIVETKRNGLILAIAYMDLDNFKPINDTYGHAEGDRLLVQVASRMAQSLREVDTIARIGGDEFVCLLPNLEDKSVAKVILDRLTQSLNQPIWVGGSSQGEQVSVSTSIGVTFVQGEDVDPDTLLRRADQLMYSAKRRGGGIYLTDPGAEEV